MAKKVQKTGKRAATSRKSGGAKKKAAARRPASAESSGSGLVYTDLLREALARRRG